MTVLDTPIFPASKLGEYQVAKEHIGEGAFGVVKRAIHTVTGHQVAMKYISKSQISKDRNKTRVKREFEYMRALRHPHIVKLYEVISTPSDIIFVLEFAGGELYNYIYEKGTLPEPVARRFFQQLISGIEYSHRLKIVHRDLKPENVLLDDDLNVKIADFGLSREISDGAFLSTSCGSPNYAAPEVIRGSIYAGPEIDVWSAGVILFVMLTGSLPFEDEDVQRLFAKITHGQYIIPHHLSPDAKDLLSKMLAVDPVKRITVPQITNHPFFTKDLPKYLQPLPQLSAVVGQLSSLVAPPAQANYELIEGLGIIEDDIVDKLTALLCDMSREEVMLNLRSEDPGNTVKVSYMLLRDKERLGKELCIYAEAERDAQIAAMDPRHALSPGAMSPSGNDLEDNPFEAEFVEESLLAEEEYEFEPASVSNFGVLDSSLPQATANGENHLSSYASAKRSGGSRAAEKRHRTRWHFGIRSRSPPMEIMLELYKTLKVLGMQWKEKKNLGGLGGIQRRFNHTTGKMEFTDIRRNTQLDGPGEPPVDRSTASQIYFIETRAKVGDVVILMNLQLYMMDSSNYLVDFHHKGSYLASKKEGASKYDPATPEEKIQLYEELESVNTAVHGPVTRRPPYIEGMDGDGVVVSPYLFMDVACKLILELAGGGE